MFASLKTRTGSSPYEIDLNKQLSTGSGYYALSGGVSLSKVLDPVVLFGSVNVGCGIPIDGLDQVRGGALLFEVESDTTLPCRADLLTLVL